MRLRSRMAGFVAVVVGLVACDGGTKSDAETSPRTDGGMANVDGGSEVPTPGEGEQGGDVEVPLDWDAGTDEAAEDAGTATKLPVSKRFDLATPSTDLFRAKPLHENRVMQSFAFDIKNARIFTAQLREGSSGDDLCISQLDLTGRLIGSMHLDAAGHGVSIGVETVGPDSYLWVETDSSNTTDSGRGTAVLRFKFEDGKTPKGTKLLAGSKTITVATDPVNERLAVRRIEGGKFYYSVYPLASAAKGDFAAPIVRFAQPALSNEDVVFQGFTIFGQYLYTLDGSSHANSADIDSFVTAIDMNTGKVKSRALTKAGGTLIFREPEGLAIYRTSGGEPRLFMGFASHDVQGGSLRFANLFFKNVLVD